MSILDRIPGLFVRRGRSWLVALALILVAGGVIGGLKEAARSPGATDNLPAGADSTRVVELLADFPQRQGSSAVVLYTADGGLDPAVVAQLGRQPELQGGPPPQLAKDCPLYTSRCV